MGGGEWGRKSGWGGVCVRGEGKGATPRVEAMREGKGCGGDGPAGGERPGVSGEVEKGRGSCGGDDPAGGSDKVGWGSRGGEAKMDEINTVLTEASGSTQGSKEASGSTQGGKKGET